MENSLDAKATKVDVEIVKGGKRFIGVRDNGIGIPSEDIKKAILSGATSKIRSLEDLQSINTYGYRGEALHAISLVSRFTLRSRFYQEGVGREIRVEGGKVVAEREVGMPVGTHAEVYDIFYNLPLRRVFLKKEDVERKRIYSIFKALALANPSVAFRLEAEGKEVFNFKAVDHIKDRVEDIFEERFEHLMGEEGPFKVDLFLSDRARGLFLFINNRPVNNKSLMEYIKRSTGRWRACVCYIQTPPYLLDVNIHPKKTEVKILREGRLKELIGRTLPNKNWTGISLKQSTKGYALGGMCFELPINPDGLIFGKVIRGDEKLSCGFNSVSFERDEGMYRTKYIFKDGKLSLVEFYDTKKNKTLRLNYLDWSKEGYVKVIRIEGESFSFLLTVDSLKF